jgi:hypothetical protein
MPYTDKKPCDPRPDYECGAIEISEAEAIEIPKVETFPEANVSPLAYYDCATGWSHFVILEVIDIE